MKISVNKIALSILSAIFLLLVCISISPCVLAQNLTPETKNAEERLKKLQEKKASLEGTVSNVETLLSLCDKAQKDVPVILEGINQTIVGAFNAADQEKWGEVVKKNFDQKRIDSFFQTFDDIASQFGKVALPQNVVIEAKKVGDKAIQLKALNEKYKDAVKNASQLPPDKKGESLLAAGEPFMEGLADMQVSLATLSIRLNGTIQEYLRDLGDTRLEIDYLKLASPTKF